MPDEINDAPETTEEEPFSIDPQEWQEVQETLGMIREAMSQPEPAPEPQQNEKQLKIPDPFSETYAQDLEAYTDARFGQLAAPLQAHTEESLMAEAEERAMDIIADLKSEKGDLPEGGAQVVRALANEYVAEMQEQYGFGPAAAEAALAKAYDTFQALRQSDNKSYYEQQMNELATLGEARREPPTQNTGASQGLDRVKGDEMAVVRNIFQGQR